MSVKRALILAVLTGAEIEAICCGLFVGFGEFGPCGSGNALTDILLWLHQPGITVAENLFESDWIRLTTVVVITALLWSVVAFGVILAGSNLYRRPKQQADTVN